MTQHIEKYLPREPENLNKRNWFYYESKGINLVHEVLQDGMWAKTDKILIPWKTLEKALEIYKKAKVKQSK